MSDAMVDVNWLCNWLDENSSCPYRPAKDAAHVIRSMQRELIAANQLVERLGDNLANAELDIRLIKEQKPAYKIGWQYDEGNEDPELGGDLVLHQLDGKDYPIGTLFYAYPFDVNKAT